MSRFYLIRALFVACIAIASCFVSPFVARADIVYESATLGPPHGGGTRVPVTGSWFSLSETTRITAIGGHLSISNGPATVDSVWASIIEISAGVMPTNGFDIEANSLVSGVIGVQDGMHGDSSDLRVDVDALLGPGEYAILLGGRGLFGTNSTPVMPRNGIDFPDVDYFSQYYLPLSSDLEWDNNDVILRSGTRLVVEGTAIPEPSSLMFVGSVFIAGVFRRRRVA
ncbi:PEP-CTERM sorting domain-containing protein [Stieleria sp. JC731]|uniref:PEP-CTERM sorting domain-containing protein n=1 Tax=Pirellulaceae TaxID=2691357 RepID=UPI001E54F04D|nr:PEP-CTERM sorting domain-containing protein [Stieleria sp. JC731]MCC9603740.1 PEP-CTERM sorting domain-containing protein [Stieleria sp. JC731]